LFIRTLLYPARLVYSWSTGLMGSNDDAVAFTRKHPPTGMNTDILTSALKYRQAAADPDELFPARGMLPDQVKSCLQFIADSARTPASSYLDHLVGPAMSAFGTKRTSHE